MYQPAMKARMSELEQQKAEIEKRLEDVFPGLHVGLRLGQRFREADHLGAVVFRDIRMHVRPRNHLNLRNPGPSGRGFRFEGNCQDSGEIAPDVDLQLAGLRGKDDFLHERTQDLAGLEPRCRGIILYVNSSQNSLNSAGSIK